MPDQNFLHKELTYEIIGAAMEVHRVLGHGFLESVYEEALAHELGLRNIPFARQVDLRVKYKKVVAGTFRADFFVADKVIVEIKAMRALSGAEEAQLLNYLRGTGYHVGLLVNFGTRSLQHKRRVL